VTNAYPPVPPGKWIYLPFLGWAKVASVGRRFAALIIDALCGVAVVVLLVLPALILAPTTTGPAGLLLLLAGLFTGAVLNLLYQWLMISYLGQTLGKMAVGVKVVRAEDGLVPGLGKSLGRLAIVMGSGSLPLVGGIAQLVLYVSVFFDRAGRNQTWYDKALSTLVIAVR
jgi:uncharacterized RDD family membrane protein YckC